MRTSLRSTRNRVLLAMLAACAPLALWATVASYQLDNLVRYYQNHEEYLCQATWRQGISTCEGERVNLVGTWLQLIGFAAAAVLLCYLLARWVLRPLRDIEATVTQFGPNNLGLRMNSSAGRDEVRRLSDAIDAMLDRLTEGYEAQRRFAANASHELRTPLATQRALIEVSLTGPLTPDQLDLLSRQLLATNERNEKLIDGLLTLAETERGVLAHDRLRLDVLVATAVETLRPMADQRDLTVRCDDAAVSVIGESALLERLATNLVHNAIKYNDPGGWVRVQVRPDGVLSVINTGPVVAPEQVAGLFEPFRRLSGERLDHGGGVGLGLTIARSIVAAHGGSIEASPNPGGGLVVQARLPVVS